MYFGGSSCGGATQLPQKLSDRRISELAANDRMNPVSRLIGVGDFADLAYTSCSTASRWLEKLSRMTAPKKKSPTWSACANRALIGVMVYTFARVNVVIGMKVKDYFVQGRRGWVRLHEKGGEEHEVPCHHNLEQFLHRRRRHRRRLRRSLIPHDRACSSRCGSRTRIA